MIRILEQRDFSDGLKFVKLAGLSTDSKPTGGMVTGSTFLAVDTGDEYAYNEASSGSWAKIRQGVTTE